MTEVAEGGDVAGIGVAFAQDTTRGRGGSPEVVAVVPGSSAAEAGVEVGDRLVEVDGQSMRVPADAARWIPGRPGTWANVRFQRRASVKGSAMKAPLYGLGIHLRCLSCSLAVICVSQYCRVVLPRMRITR